jgi:hypothetical protein
MPTERLKIGVALASYKPDLKLFAIQLRSILAQTHTNWVCVITSDTPLAPVLADSDLVMILADPRFVVRENSARLGHKKNFEAAVKLLIEKNPDAVAFSDQDDLWYPWKLERLLEDYRKLPPFSLVQSDMDLIYDGSDVPTGQSGWEVERRGVDQSAVPDLLVRNVVAGCALLMDAELARLYPIIPDEFDYHDHWYAALAATLGKIVSIPDRLYAYRQHSVNVVGITAYPGFFALDKKYGVRGFFEKLYSTQARSRARAEALGKAVGLSAFSRITFLSRFDLGLGYLLETVRGLLAKDLPLARASLARALGKALFCLGIRPVLR